MRIVKVIDLINPVFYPMYLANESHIVAKGGRSSFKSSVISIMLLERFLSDVEGNVICLRKVGKYLRTSVYEQIKWAILTFGVEHEFTFMRVPLQIIHKQTGTGFYFFGVDDPMKLKSAKIAAGYVMALWFEELAEFSGVEDIDTVEDTYIRQSMNGKEVRIYFSYNPPRNPYAWVNEWVEQKRTDADYLIHHSTYQDDKLGFLSQQLRRKIQRYQENDHDYYRWMYLGEVIGLGDNVYNMELFQICRGAQEGDTISGLYYAADTGHQVSATTCLCMGVTVRGNVVLLDTYYYSPAGKRRKLAPSELSNELHGFIKRTSRHYGASIIRRTIDSAEGGLRNQYYKDYGIRWSPVSKRKKADMIDFVQNLLAQGRFYYVDKQTNQIFLEEHKQYQWDQKTMTTQKPEVIKQNDHTCDALQYFVVDNLRALGLTS